MVHGIQWPASFGSGQIISIQHCSQQAWVKLLNLRLNPHAHHLIQCGGFPLSTTMMDSLPYQLWDIFARTFLFASESNPTQTLSWFTYLGPSVVGLASGTAGSRSSKTVCPLHSVCLHILTCVGFTIACFLHMGVVSAPSLHSPDERMFVTVSPADKP